MKGEKANPLTPHSPTPDSSPFLPRGNTHGTILLQPLARPRKHRQRPSAGPKSRTHQSEMSQPASQPAPPGSGTQRPAPPTQLGAPTIQSIVYFSLQLGGSSRERGVLPWLKRKKQTKSRASWRGLIPQRQGQVGLAASFSLPRLASGVRPPRCFRGARALRSLGGSGQVSGALGVSRAAAASADQSVCCSSRRGKPSRASRPGAHPCPAPGVPGTRLARLGGSSHRQRAS